MSDFAYDQVQYESHPYRLSHPEHLYTLAKVFGLTPKDYTQARILELGCASGGNIIPVAYNYPDCKIVGIDLSKKQIEAGKLFVNSLDIQNIELLTMSILDVDQTLGKFDYIICHGIYSWVDEPIRNKILNIFRDNLSEQGIAYISYNTYPGWHMVQSIRDMMLFHTQALPTPQAKATQARKFLEFLVEGLKEEKTPYSEFLDHELSLLKKQPDSYLLHDHLEEINFPVYFHTFMEQANQNNLDYLADAKLYTMFSGNLPKKTASILNGITNIIRNSQYMDFIRNQRFRSTLLCSNKVTIKRQINKEHIENFYLSYIGGYAHTEMTQSDILTEGIPLSFTGAGITLTLKNAISKVAMILLQTQNQVPILYDDFINKLKKKLEAYGIHHEVSYLKQHLNRDLNLIRLVFGGIIALSASPALYTIVCSDTPKVTNLVKEQAKNKQVVTNQRHEVIRINDFERVLIQSLDGHTTKAGIVEDLVHKMEQGEFIITDDAQNTITEPTEVRAKIKEFCEQAYQRFANSALLINEYIK